MFNFKFIYRTTLTLVRVRSYPSSVPENRSSDFSARARRPRDPVAMPRRVLCRSRAFAVRCCSCLRSPLGARGCTHARSRTTWFSSYEHFLIPSQDVRGGARGACSIQQTAVRVAQQSLPNGSIVCKGLCAHHGAHHGAATAALGRKAQKVRGLAGWSYSRAAQKTRVVFVVPSSTSVSTRADPATE